MKILGEHIEKGDKGSVKIRIEDDEDMWQVYNLVMIGDQVTASTQRKMQTVAQTGSVISSKRKMNLTIKVGSIDYDPQRAEIRYSGRVARENEYVRAGAFHTLEICPMDHESTGVIEIGKDCWDTVVYQRLRDACNITLKADVAAVVMQEGLAHLCLITPSMTILKQKIETNIPRKRGAGAESHDKAMKKFFESVYQSIQRHVNWEVVKCFLVCSPGFIHQDFTAYAMQVAVQRDHKEMQKSKSMWMGVPCGNGYLNSLKEVLQDKGIASRLSDTKAMSEVKSMDQFFAMMGNDEDRVAYGALPVQAAVEKDAVQLLLILDTLFRSRSIAERKKWVAMVEDVQNGGGEVKIFSSMHATGEQLSDFMGVAAILRFPCPELNDIDSDQELDVIPTNTSYCALDSMYPEEEEEDE